eukprot:1852729-Rhodomonas_salina.1
MCAAQLGSWDLTLCMAVPGQEDGPVASRWIPHGGLAAYAWDEDGTPEPRWNREVQEGQAQGERCSVRVGAQVHVP